MRYRNSVTILSVVSFGIAVGFGIRSVLADGIPALNPLYYSGTLTEGGALVTGTRALTVNLWPDSAAAGMPLCQTVVSSAPISGGRFRVRLASSCKPVVNQNANVWVEVIDGATSLGRSPISAVPYAVEADHAVNATSATTALYAADAGHASTADNATGASNATFAVPNALTVGGNASVAGVLSLGLHSSTNCAAPDPVNAFIDCTCGANELAIGGGAYSGGGGIFLDESRNISYPNMGGTWRLGCGNASGVRVACVVPFAVCARVAQ